MLSEVVYYCIKERNHIIKDFTSKDSENIINTNYEVKSDWSFVDIKKGSKDKDGWFIKIKQF